jgi:hypothetical protein
MFVYFSHVRNRVDLHLGQNLGIQAAGKLLTSETINERVVSQ